MIELAHSPVLFHEEPIANADNVYRPFLTLAVKSGDGFGVPSFDEGLDATHEGGGRLFVPNEYKDHFYTDKDLEWHEGLGEYTGDGKGRGF